ncbi:serine/threonine-protein kinase [Francisella philomiragia]|uniref:serine/threonine-protein kinase n=1 Tax=Francisella philomiragia TaxID=28110 RepID=UPI001C9DC93D|nr:serine/threonine-protein kinase [Francisella philomiragia]MBY7735082.1 protein kinase [Francisella philomiragia]
MAEENNNQEENKKVTTAKRSTTKKPTSAATKKTTSTAKAKSSTTRAKSSTTKTTSTTKAKSTTTRAKSSATRTTASKKTSGTTKSASKPSTTIVKTVPAKKTDDISISEKSTTENKVSKLEHHDVSGLANDFLRKQATGKVANITNNKTDSNSTKESSTQVEDKKEDKPKDKPKIVKADTDKTITIVEQSSKSKSKTQKKSEIINIDSDATLTAGTSTNLSIGNKDKKLAYQMLDEKRVLNDRFQLEDIIGIGGMGIVYRATDIIRQQVKPNNCSVAIKVLSQDVKKYKQAFLALQREAYKEQQLSHPNVIKVYDFNRCDDAVYKVMELIDGIHLKEWMKEARNSGKAKSNCENYIKQVKHIINEVAKGLEYVHNQGIVHSDLKPSNVFVLENGDIKIFDFGIARTIKTTNFNQKDPDASIFDPTTFAAFTPKYASYEMLTRQAPSPADDVYALGCIMYEMLTGHHPYNGKNAKDALELEMSPEKLNDIDSDLQDLVMSMLELKKEDRIQNMTDILDKLNQQYLPSIEKQNHYDTSYTVDTNSLIINKPFILTISLLLGVANLYGLSTWFKPKSETYVITDPVEVKEAVAENTTESRQIIGTTPGCESIISSVDPNGEKCLLSLKTDNGNVYRLNMLVFSGEDGSNYAISKDPLNNISVSSLGEHLTTEEQENPLAVHKFTKQSLQTFYIRTVSLYGNLGLATPKQIVSLSNNGQKMCDNSASSPNSLDFMGKDYGEAVIKGGSSFDVLSVTKDCSIKSTPLTDYNGENIITRLVWKPTR